MPDEIEVLVDLSLGGVLPHYATDGAAGVDLRSTEDVELGPGERQLVKTGLRMVIPPGFEGQVRPRSGLALKHGIGIVNSPGTIDSDYRGEIGIILINWSDSVVKIPRGDRIAQLVLCPVTRAVFRTVDGVTDFETERGDGGFGSTGR